MRIELKFAGDIPIIRLSGRFIAGGDGPFLRQKVADLIEAGSRKLVVDFQDVPYLDSTGLGFLAGSQKLAQTAGATIVLCDLNEHVRKVLGTAQLEQFFVLAANEEDALEKLQAIPERAPESTPAPMPPPAAPSAPAKTSRGRKRSAPPDPKDPQTS
jgi:anti-sigma B factor antagonist